MRILSLVTKRSIREPDSKRQVRMFFTSRDFTVGDIIEIIDGNKKAAAYVYKCEPASNHKQAIRTGELDLPKLKLSKTGEYQDGVVMTSYKPADFVSYMKEPKIAHATNDSFLKNFFPKKRTLKPKVTKKKTPKADSFSSLSVDKYFGQKADHHSEMHELVDNIRKYFGENARYGQGSFSYYLGFFKKIPNRQVRQMFAEAKNSPKDRIGQKKIFWWKVGQYVKKK